MQINATILGEMITFFLFVFFCMKFLWPPIIFAIEKRQKEIIKSKEISEKTKKELEKAKKRFLEIISDAKKEAKTIINNAHYEKKIIIENTKKEAEIKFKKVMEKAFLEIKFERKKAYEDIKKEVTDLIIFVSEKFIKHTLNNSINKKIIKNFISKL